MGVKDKIADDGFDSQESNGIWKYVDEVMRYKELLNDYGFADSSAIRHKIVVLVVGNRLHPAKGLDYLGENWQMLNDRQFLESLSDRRIAVERIRDEVLAAIEKFGFESACRVAREISEYQVVYLSCSEEETTKQIQTLIEDGLGVNEFSGGVDRRAGNDLVFVFEEHYSYFVKD